eukprot:199091-Chlamydomonas_euryale.AAC.1
MARPSRPPPAPLFSFLCFRRALMFCCIHPRCRSHPMSVLAAHRPPPPPPPPHLQKPFLDANERSYLRPPSLQ